MSVRAKFVVTNKEDTISSGSTIKMSAVTADGPDSTPDDHRFFKYTPSGQLTISTVNEDAAAAFIVGQKYYLDFTPAE